MRLGFPGLPRGDAGGRARRPPEKAHEAGKAARVPPGSARQCLEGQHDQSIARQNGDGRAEGDVDRLLLAAHRRVVEAGQIVVDEGSAMQQLDRRRRRIGPTGSSSPQASATERQRRGRMR